MLALIAAPLAAQSELYPTKPTNYLTDVAQVIPAQDAAVINRNLAELRDSQHTQMAVVTLPTIENYSPADVALSIGRSWGVATSADIGDPTRNAGLVMVVVPKTSGHRGECYIVTARGVEGFITDSKAGAICRSMITEFFKQGNYAGGIMYGVDLVRQAVKANITVPQTAPTHSIPLWIILSPIAVVILVGITLYAFFHKDPEPEPYIPPPAPPAHPTYRVVKSPPSVATVPPTRKYTEAPLSSPVFHPPADPEPVHHHHSSSSSSHDFGSSSSFSDFSGGSGSGAGFSGGGGGGSW